MKQHELLFLEALKASLNNQKVTWDFTISQETWKQIFELAGSQKVLPLIFEAVYASPAIRSTDFQFYTQVKRVCMEQIIGQTQKTEEFFEICKQFAQAGEKPLVVKGIVCRQLYPKPDLRISADEDILVTSESFECSKKILKDYGMRQLGTDDSHDVQEVGFLSEKGRSYIELHQKLFSEESEVYGDWNHYFLDCFDNCVALDIQGNRVYTMEPTTHLFYLICHAFKHFLHSGFGMRQVCDMVVFANAYGEEIDWKKILVQCREIRADKFVAALFKIGKNYLTFDDKKACYTKSWKKIEVDEEPLLKELLCSGIYGNSSMSRKHSSNITLEAVSAQKSGKKEGNGLKASLFPAAKKLEGKYTYLKKQPYLLPIAWGDRLLKYYKETAQSEDNRALDAVRIGNERIQLLKTYGILEK